MSKRELSNVDVVILAVHQLGGLSVAQDTEDIAVEADRLAPGRFRWRKYPEFISDHLIGASLSDAKKPKNGHLLAGDGTKGWRLTVDGAKVAAGLSNSDLNPSRNRKDRELERRFKLEANRLTDSPAWEKYSAGRAVARRDAEGVFRVGDYTKGDRREEMIERVRLLFLNDSELGPFVEAMAALLMNKGN